MALAFTEEDIKLLLLVEILNPLVIEKLKQAGFSEDEITTANKYLGLQLVVWLVRNLLADWNKHNTNAVFSKEILLSLIKISHKKLHHEKVKEKIELAVKGHNPQLWQDVLKEISKEGYKEISDDFVKCLIKLALEEAKNAGNN